MMGLVYKDFMVLRKQISYYLVFVVVYTVLVVAGVFSAGILSALVVVTGMMLPMSSFGYDDLARWDKYAAATPAGRRGVVGGKYLFALLCTAVSAALLIVFQSTLALLGLLEDAPLDLVVIALSCAGVTLFINALVLPLLIKFGAEKSRTISMILFVGVFGGIMLLSTWVQKAGALPAPPAWLLRALPVVLPLICVGGFVVSYFIAQGISEKKEL